jgi:hypothetical protein
LPPLENWLRSSSMVASTRSPYLLSFTLRKTRKAECNSCSSYQHCVANITMHTEYNFCRVITCRCRLCPKVLLSSLVFGCLFPSMFHFWRWIIHHVTRQSVLAQPNIKHGTYLNMWYPTHPGVSSAIWVLRIFNVSKSNVEKFCNGE